MTEEQRDGFYIIYWCDRQGEQRILNDVATELVDALKRKQYLDLQADDEDRLRGEFRIGFLPKGKTSFYGDGLYFLEDVAIVHFDAKFKPATTEQREGRRERI